MKIEPIDWHKVQAVMEKSVRGGALTDEDGSIITRGGMDM